MKGWDNPTARHARSEMLEKACIDCDETFEVRRVNYGQALRCHPCRKEARRRRNKRWYREARHREEPSLKRFDKTHNWSIVEDPTTDPLLRYPVAAVFTKTEIDCMLQIPGALRAGTVLECRSSGKLHRVVEKVGGRLRLERVR